MSCLDQDTVFIVSIERMVTENNTLLLTKLQATKQVHQQGKLGSV